MVNPLASDRRSPSGAKTDIKVRGLFPGDNDPILTLDKSDQLVPVPGAKVGAAVQVTVNNSLTGIIAVGRVTVAGTVEVVLNNVTAADIAVPLGGWDLTIVVSA
jgi:hypothetical protein